MYSPRRVYLLILTPLVLACTATAQAQGPRQVAYQPQQQRSPAELIQRQAEPKITLRLMSSTGPENSRVYVSLGKQRAYLINTTTDEIVIDSPISSGKVGHATPKGKYTIKEKDRDHRSSIYGDFVDGGGRVVRRGVSTKIDSAPSGTKYVGASMKWFMRLTGEGVGMHTGILPGYAASHGCIRMPEQIAQMFYERVKVGTPAVVAD